MVEKVAPARPKRVTYKAYVALFPGEWGKLRLIATDRRITGGELIASILSRYLAEYSEPLPEDPGPDPDQ